MIVNSMFILAKATGYMGHLIKEAVGDQTSPQKLSERQRF
jgi:hypothetical protein